MRLRCGLFLLVLLATPAFAQLTLDQKLSDFQAVAGLYAKQYGPYQWKIDAFHYDLLNVQPWLDQISATKTDLDFYDVMSRYVASLNDAHDTYQLPANFAARLNFTVDIFDGKLLVDTINRTRLPAAEYPFQIGYELVSIDGQDAQKLVDGLLQYSVAANSRSTRRLAAGFVTYRPQALIPRAADVPEISTVVFRHPDGTLFNFRIPWTKSGLLLTSVGRYVTPQIAIGHRDPAIQRHREPPVATTNYMAALEPLWNCKLPDRAISGFGALAPVFAASLPLDFQPRLGQVTTDPFYSGTYTSAGRKIGFIRIPSYSPSNSSTALNAFATEMAYFQANTDGLVIDEMRNPGGSLSYMNVLVSLLMPKPWDSIPFEVRANSDWVASISSSYESVKAAGAPDSVLALYQQIKDALISANREMRGMTVPIPLDDVVIKRNPALDSKGVFIGYSKPLIVLTDELSASAADLFAATIQDNLRGPLVGFRTMGAGGGVVGWEAGSYSLASTTVTQSLMYRKPTIITSEYPPTHYIENVGVRPDVELDYMTRDNLVQNGRPFVDAFTRVIVDLIGGRN